MAAIVPGSGGAPATFADRLRAAGVVPVVEVEDAGRAVALAQTLEAGGMPIELFETNETVHSGR
jgi:2-keto-3-deoxy-6-phosphogluconate aldolase